MAATVATPLEKAFSAIAGHRRDHVEFEPRLDQHHAAVLARPRCRERGAGRERGDRQDAAVPAAQHSAAELPQAESVGGPDHQHRADVERAVAAGHRRVRGDDDRAAAVDDRRRRAGERVGVGEVRGARAARPGQARHARHRRVAGGRADPAEQRDAARRACSTGRTARSRSRRRDSSCERGGLPAPHRDVEERRPGAARRSGQRARRHPEQQELVVLQRRAHDQPDGHAPAGHEHRRGRETGQSQARGNRKRPAVESRRTRAVRPVRGHQELGRRREALAADRARARRDGDLPVPAQRRRDADSEPHAADGDRRRRSRSWRC